jgi:hypothetical protein
MANAPQRRRSSKRIAADLSAQRPNNSYAPITKYEDQRVECSACGRPTWWTARRQRWWYEEVKASIYATVSIRCETCRKRGPHDAHRRAQRTKARRRAV